MKRVEDAGADGGEVNEAPRMEVLLVVKCNGLLETDLDLDVTLGGGQAKGTWA